LPRTTVQFEAETEDTRPIALRGTDRSSDAQFWFENSPKGHEVYGLANRALKQLVVMRAGPAVWTEICSRVGLEEEEFHDFQQYPDSITYEIINSASEKLGTPTNVLMTDFGRHWILFTSQSRYGHLFERAHDDLEEFLHQLNEIHNDVAESMPELVPPDFGVQKTDAGLVVLYASERDGLEPMVIGMLEGLVELYGSKGTVSQLRDSKYGENRFLITSPSA
jgi:hypothetical protein